jgi:hypothetical protein
MTTSSKLEADFKQLMDTVGEEIFQRVRLAEENLRAAVELSDKHGIPFFSNVSELGQAYVPNSFSNKWKKLSKELVRDLTEVFPDDLKNGDGWSHSQIC